MPSGPSVSIRLEPIRRPSVPVETRAVDIRHALWRPNPTPGKQTADEFRLARFPDRDRQRSPLARTPLPLPSTYSTDPPVVLDRLESQSDPRRPPHRGRAGVHDAALEIPRGHARAQLVERTGSHGYRHGCQRRDDRGDEQDLENAEAVRAASRGSRPGDMTRA